MINEYNLRYVESIFGTDYDIANRDKGEITYSCPWCSELGHRDHNDKKLYVNVNKLKYFCFRCESKGSLRSELSDEFNTPDLYGVLNSYLSNERSIEDETTYFNISPYKLIDYKDSMAYQYMKSRGFTDEDIDKYSMRLPKSDSDLMGRVIIPNKIISKNWTDIYTARTYIGDPKRYKNPYNARKSEILFNYHNIPDNPEYMILNEGALNSIIAGDLSIASYGKYLSTIQKQMIIDKHPKKLYLSYDTDARDHTLQLCDDLISRSNIEIYLVELPEQWDPSENKMKGLDAVDLGREKYLDIVFNSKKFINSRIYNILGGVS